jgi:hypothetical protein
MTQINKGFFFLLFLITSVLVTGTISLASQNDKARHSAKPGTCPVDLFSVETCSAVNIQQSEHMTSRIPRAVKNLHRFLRPSPSAAVRASLNLPNNGLPLRRHHDMSSSASPSTASTQSPNDQSRQGQSSPKLSLPSTSDRGIKVDVSGDASTVSLDHLGPIVVNQDGTMSRISNWDQMTQIEKKNTLRVLGKRNKQRLEALRAAGVQPGEKGDAPS